MQAILIYLLKSTIYSSILLLYYHIALRNKRFHYYNRFYLLMSVALSLLLPFLNIELWQVQSSSPQVIQLMNVVVVSNSEKNNDFSGFMLSWSAVGELVYALTVLCMLIAFVASLYKLYYFKRIYPSEQLGDIHFINTDLQQAPFSFFNNLFWKNSIDIAEDTGKQIFKHELTHIEQKHSWDKLFLRLTTTIFWVNPFYWFIQKELSVIHEFIADEKAIENKNAKDFALMLLQSQYGKHIFSPAQSFNYSPIKRRLLMLTTSAKTSYSYTRRILVLPLLAGIILLFAFKLKENKQTFTVVHTNAPFILVVDAGHGGSVDGAIGANGIKEKDINLTIAKQVQALAPEYGITVKMTRTADVAVDLRDRMSFIEAIHPDAFVSVHVSTTEEQQTSKNEVNVYITRTETNSNYQQSRLLGSSLLQAAKQDFPVNTTLRQHKEEGIYVIDQNPYPAVLVECGYMNNIENVKQLQDADKVEQMARDILQGVVAYANAVPQAAITEAEDTTGKAPLYIVDGKEIPAAEVKKIDGAKIESMNVLKAEEAIKVYGEKGKNGVILITLKKTASATSASPSTQIGLTDSTAAKEAEKALKLVDGKIISNEELEKLNPDDIESISVFKDENTIKKYGEKGKYGVIEIRTKNYNKKQSPTIVKEEMVYPKNDSTVDFTGNTGIHKIVEVKYNDTSITGKQYEKVFTKTQIAPAFPGGNDAWVKYLQKNLHSDVPVNNQAPTGTYTAMISFIVDENGNISDVKAIKDPGYGTGAEAVRVIKEGPKWLAAVQNGHKVTALTKQAISFRVEEGR